MGVLNFFSKSFSCCACSSYFLNKWCLERVEVKICSKCIFNCAINWTFDFWWKKNLTVHFRDKTCFHFIMQTRSTKFSLSRIEPFCFHTPELATCHLDSPSCNFIMCCFYNLQYLHIFCFLIFLYFSASRAWIRIAPLAFQLWLYGILDLHTEVRKYKYPHIMRVMRLKALYRVLMMSPSVLKS